MHLFTSYLLNLFTAGTSGKQSVTTPRHVSLIRTGPSEPWGLQLLGHMSPGIDPGSRAIFICGIVPGSVAASSNTVNVGDQILEVNGHSFALASREIASNAFKTCSTEAQLIGKKYFPQHIHNSENKQENLSQDIQKFMLRSFVA